MPRTRNGTIITPALSSTGQDPTSITDANGNEINFSGTGSFTDTTGNTALTISGSGPITFTYPVVNQSNGSTTAQATLTYRQYTVRTNFGCPNIVEYGSNSVNLVDHITLADGSTYSFTYEGTPGASDGAVSARIASITLPTGGTISYAYSGGCGTGSGTGIETDGSQGILTRTTSDGTRTYGRAGINSNATSTTVTDEKGNQTYLAFTIDSAAGRFYETHRKVYQGAAGGTPLQETFTCYNNAAADCDGQTVSPPLTEADVTTSFNGGAQVLNKNAYDSTGTVLMNSKVYSGSTVWQNTTNSYNVTANGIYELTSSSTTDISGNTIASVTYGYDEGSTMTPPGASPPQHASVSGPRGNQTSSSISTGSSSPLTTSTVYYDTGQPMSVNTLSGATTYGYDPTQTFTTSTALPTPSSGVSLSTSASYDAASGALLSATGMNAGQTATINTFDPLLRPTLLTLPNSGAMSFVYSPNQTNSYQQLNSNVADNAAAATLRDAYGRVSRQETFNGQSGNPWYQTDYCYDAAGLLQFVPTTYQSTGFDAAIRCSGAGKTYQHDALGRVTSVATDDGTTTIHPWNRAVQTTDVNGVQRITQYDLLGRISGVCELSGTNLGDQSPTDCGMALAGTGYLTTYAYSSTSNGLQTVTVTQGQQQRIFTTDLAGRTVSVTEPERGTTTYSYSYNGTGLQVVRTRPSANQQDPSVKTTTTTQYDSLNRPISIQYSDGTPTRTFEYDAPANGWYEAPLQNNMKGRLSLGVVVTPAGTDGMLYSYDVSGNVTANYECEPSGCGNASYDQTVSYGHDFAGNLTSESDPTSGLISYGRSPAGEVTSITQGTYQNAQNPANLVANVANSPFGPTTWALGNGLEAVRSYDSRGRNSGNYVCAGTAAPGCTNGTSLYGDSVQYRGKRVLQVCDTVSGECANSGYDEFNRLTSMTDIAGNNGDIGSFSYSYDRWGNRLSQTSSVGGPSPNSTVNPANNQMTSIPYDAAGNMMSDGISHSFSYDAEGNVVAVDGGNTAAYVYDAFNHRVRSQTSSGTSEFVFDAFGRRTSTWNTSIHFGVEGRIYWDGAQIAYRGQGGQTFFQHKNYLGTERFRTNYQGMGAATESSLFFGDGFQQNVYASGADQDNDQFAGQEHDAESFSEHAQFRQYNSTQGRWMSPDPYDGSYNPGNPQSFNRYSYVLNNPLRSLDPLGLDSVICSTIYYSTDSGDSGVYTPTGGGGDNPIPDAPPQDSTEIRHGTRLHAADEGSDTTCVTIQDSGGVNGGSGLSGTIAPAPTPALPAPSAPSKPGQPKPSCGSQILSKYGATVGLDALGTFLGAVPGAGAGLVTAQVAVGLAGAANSAYQGDVKGTLVNSIGGAQLSAVAAGADTVGFTAAKTFGGSVARSLPWIGSAVSAYYFYQDATEALDKYQECKAGVGG